MLLQGRHSLRKTPAGRVWGDLIGFAKNHFSFRALLDLLAFSFGKLSWANAPLSEREAILPRPSLQPWPPRGPCESLGESRIRGRLAEDQSSGTAATSLQTKKPRPRAGAFQR